MSVRKYKNKSYLNCSGRTNLHICEVSSFKISVEELEANVQKELKNILAKCNIEENQNIPLPTANKQKIELTKIEQKIEKLIISLTESSEITMTYINREIEKLDKKRNEILKNLEFPKYENLNKFKDVIFHTLNFEDKKFIVGQLIEKILVFEDRIEIDWKA